ncbi:MAG: hypothetical protein E7399_06795 [Ruminococcaceae bacterium]|nr:hypothetical protein [Oscillospiraceae bacterium]
MFKKQYQKANDEIPLNEELLASLLELNEVPHKQRKASVSWIGVVATAAVIAIGVFSYSHFKMEQMSSFDSVADKNQTNTKVSYNQESKVKEQLSADLEESNQREMTEDIQQHPTSIPTHHPMIISSPIAEEGEEKTEEKEMNNELPVTASVVTPRTVPTNDETQELPPVEPQPSILPEHNDLDTDVSSSPVTASIEHSDDLQVSGGGASSYPQNVSIGGSSAVVPNEKTETSEMVSETVVVDNSVSTSYSPTPTPTPATEIDSSETEK